MRVEKIMKIHLQSEASIELDLAKVKMSDEQRQIVNKLLDRTPGISFDDTSCIDINCHETTLPDGTEQDLSSPARKLLSEDEFEKVRYLKASLGPEGSGAASKIIINFCLHVIVLPTTPHDNVVP